MPSGKASIQLQTTSKTGLQLGRAAPQSPGAVHQVSMQQQQHPQQFYQQQQQQYPQGYVQPVQQPQTHQQYQQEVIEPAAVKPVQQFMVYGAASPQPYQPSPQPYQPPQQQYQEEVVEPEIAKPAQQFMVYNSPQGYQQQQPQQPYQATPQQQQYPQPYQQPQPQQYQQPYQAAPQQHHQQHIQQQPQPQQYQQPYQAAPQQHHQQHIQQQPQPQQYQQPYQAAPQQHHQQHIQQQPQPQQYQQPYQAAPQQHHEAFQQPQQQQQQQQPYQAAPTQHQQSRSPQYHQASQPPYQATPQQQRQPASSKPLQLQKPQDDYDAAPVNASPMPDRGSPSTTFPPPHFVRPLGNAITVSENEVVHLETQVEPAGDPSIQVEWIKDGRPIVAGSRFNTSYDRGYIVLDILSPMGDDSGHYSCVAQSNSGQDQTNPITVTVLEEESVITSTQLPEDSMMQNITSLEDSWSRPRTNREDPDSSVKAPPTIVRQLFGPTRVAEAGRAHFEARVAPPNDSGLQVDWFKDGLPLNSSCRFNVILDRGFVILDIASCIVEDSGDYFFLARNGLGQVQSNVVHMNCVGGESVITRSVLPESTIDSLNQLDNPESHITHEFSRDGLRYEEESEPESPPVFVIQPTPVQAEEGNPARFLVKVSGNPMPKVQWLINDSIIGNSNQYHIYRDGAINYLEIRRCRDHGDTRVRVVAWNSNGQSETETFLRVNPAVDFRPGLKHVAPGSNFAKLNRLKKVECSAELTKALSKTRGPTETFRNVELFSEHKARTHKSNDVVEAENLYNNVQSRLRPQERGLGGSAGYAAPTKGYEYSDI